MKALTGTKDEVKRFWSRTPCGSWDATAPEGTREYFAQIEGRRYELEPFIKRFADFGSTAGQSVLEIGVGLGTDHVQFARAGAELHGVDLTEKSVGLVARRFELEGLRSELRVADAENLGVDCAAIEKVATPYDAEYAGGLARVTGRFLGFFMIIRGTKRG